METDNRQRFSGKADLYAAGRPSYAAGFLQELRDTWGFGENTFVADIGSGTGILTKQLLDLGCRVYAVEPNADMRRIADRDLGEMPGFYSVVGDAADTKIADYSVDAITAAQAFHWFPAEEFRRECLRIGKPGCVIFLIWNQRDMVSPVTQALHALYTKYGKDFDGFNKGLKKDDERIRAFFLGDFQNPEKSGEEVSEGDGVHCRETGNQNAGDGAHCRETGNSNAGDMADACYREKDYPNPLYYDREGFQIRCLSSSHSPKPGEENYEAYMAEVNRIFDEFEENGRLEVPNVTTVYFGKLE